MDEKKLWWMNLKDKIKISKTRCCPPHYWPHKLPFGEKVTCENCHIHINPLRKLHHYGYCKILGCPNYKFMKSKDQKKFEWKDFLV